MKKSNRVLIVFGALAAVVIGAAYFQYPPFDQRDAQGAIGAVEKYRDEQIDSSDVILGDEQQRKEEAVLYGDLFQEAIRLESMSGEIGSFAASLEAADSASLDAFAKTLDSHYAMSAKEALGIAVQLQAREELSAFSGNLQAIQQGLESKIALDAKTLASFQSMLESMVISLDAKKALESNRIMEAQASLESMTQQLENRESTLDSKMLMSMSEELGSMTKALEAKQLENRVLANMMLAGRVQQLEAKILQQKVIVASKQQLESLGASLESKAGLESRITVESKITLESLSADLANRSLNLESRALANMQGRLEMRVLEAKVLQSMATMASSARQNLENRNGLESKALESMGGSLGSLSKGLENRQSELGQRYLFSMQSELGAISGHLENRQLQSKQLESKQLEAKSLESKQLQARQLESRQLAMKNLESFNSYLGSLSSALENRGFVQNREQGDLGARATALQNQTVALQNRIQM